MIDAEAYQANQQERIAILANFLKGATFKEIRDSDLIFNATDGTEITISCIEPMGVYTPSITINGAYLDYEVLDSWGYPEDLSPTHPLHQNAINALNAYNPWLAD